MAAETSYGDLIADVPGRAPERILLLGSFVHLVPLDAGRHAEDLWRELGGVENETLWTYLPDGPFETEAGFEAHLQIKASAVDAVFYAVVEQRTGRAVGHASLMRIDQKNRVIEVGNILYSRRLQRTAAGTEAMYLLAKYVFDELGYRRYEWKCNALNRPSRQAATRLGFIFEGIFRQHMIVKGRNRDTAWYSMLDSDWPARRQAFENWLSPANFDAEGRQRKPLSRQFADD